MEISNGQLEKASTGINYFVSLILCGLLILLSTVIISDIDGLKEEPQLEDFIEREELKEKKGTSRKFGEEIELLADQKTNAEKELDILKAIYDDEKSSFENWLATSGLNNAQSQNVAVIEKANYLDSLTTLVNQKRQSINQIDHDLLNVEGKKEVVDNEIDRALDQAGIDRVEAMKSFDLEVFIYRLLFVIPVILLGVFFFIRYRRSKYWPLFFGYILFSLYAFFFGLLPYLPSYGGYVHYSLGIIFSLLMGRYLINKIKKIKEKRTKELKASTQDRAKKVKKAKAEQAYNSCSCPSCNKSFLLKTWDKSIDRTKETVASVASDFCRFCGLELFKECSSCGTKNFAHLPHCSSCGENINPNQIQEEVNA